MRVIITGATSFVGAATVKEMLKRGHTVIAVVRPESAKRDLLTEPNGQAEAEGRLIIVENDLSTPELLPQKTGGPCEVFCHFGWGGSGSSARTDHMLQEKNFEYSMNTIRAAKASGCTRFLFSGSQAEYGLHKTRMSEDLECVPRSFYGESKLRMRYEGEALCKELGLDYIHARIFSAYGPGDHPWTLVESCLNAFTRDESLSLGQCTQQWNFIYIDDLARAMCALAEVPAQMLDPVNPVYNLAGTETRPLREFVEEIHALCKNKGTALYAARPENAEGIVNLIPDITKLQKTTGWIPEVSFADGIKYMLTNRNFELKL